ncbi:flagellar assembly lipoprotein FlgP [Rhodobacter sp. NSM]|uniref:flagellar assembly lipoprotein FlgP n=1 Tax=Rhodobacter sp. NSM TaxID=3457501 RepID=UPI003FD3D80F
MTLRLRPGRLAGLALPLLVACTPGPRAVDALPKDAGPRTSQLAQMKDANDALDAQAARRAAAPAAVPARPLVTGIGFSQVASQPGHTLNQRRLMAMRAARLDAMRDLAEQVHGLRLDARTTVRDAAAVNDQIAGVVSGTIRGARLLRVTPKGEDSYEVEIALDADAVGYIVKAARQR